MARGSKAAYTEKQKRKAAHIEKGYEDRGVPKKAAEARAWATVNKDSGGGNKSGSGRGNADANVASAQGRHSRPSGPDQQRSTAARKGWDTRRKNAKHGRG